MFPKMFQKAGYQTAVVGKWHLGQAVKGYDYSEILIGLGLVERMQKIVKQREQILKH
jgi:arylsulfatase A-like enzyme